MRNPTLSCLVAAASAAAIASAPAATTVFDQSVASMVAAPANLGAGGTYFDLTGGAELTQDIVHTVKFIADPVLAPGNYVLYEAGGSGTGMSIYYSVTAGGSGSVITGASLSFYSGGGNNNPVSIALDDAFSGVEINVVAGFDVSPGGGDETLYLFAGTTGVTTLTATGTDNGDNWNGGNAVGLGEVAGGGVQGQLAVGDITGTQTASSLMATSFLNGDGDSADPIDFSNVTDLSDPTFGFGLIAVPEPGVASLFFLSVLGLGLRRKRS